MELLFNLFWLAASASLGIGLLYSRRQRGVVSPDSIHSPFAAWGSYLILIAMLLPVISMTDDMQAMVNSSDSEQVVRRMESGVPSHPPVHLHRTVFLQLRTVWHAPVFEAHLLEVAQDFYPSYYWHRQTTQGRAPPSAA